MLIVVLFAGLHSPARAACPAAPVQFRADLDAAYATYAAFDIPTFSTRASAVGKDLFCLTGVLDAETAARLHLVEGLRAWLAKDPARMVASFRGLVAADPGFMLGADVAPTGSRVRTVLLDAVAAGAGAMRSLPVGPGVAVTVDGREAVDSVPAERAALVQVVSGGDAPRTWYLVGDLGSDAELPADLLAAAAGPDATADVTARPASRRDHGSRTLLLGGLAAGFASGASLGFAHDSRSEFFDADQQGDADALYTRNQALGYAGYGLGVAAVGLGVTAVVVGKW